MSKAIVPINMVIEVIFGITPGLNLGFRLLSNGKESKRL